MSNVTNSGIRVAALVMALLIATVATLHADHEEPCPPGVLLMGVECDPITDPGQGPGTLLSIAIVKPKFGIGHVFAETPGSFHLVATDNNYRVFDNFLPIRDHQISEVFSALNYTPHATETYLISMAHYDGYGMEDYIVLRGIDFLLRTQR